MRRLGLRKDDLLWFQSLKRQEHGKKATPICHSGRYWERSPKNVGLGEFDEWR